MVFAPSGSHFNLTRSEFQFSHFPTKILAGSQWVELHEFCCGRATVSWMPPRRRVKAAWKWAAPAVLLTYACNQCSGYFATFCKMAKQTILCFRKEVNGELYCRHLISCSYGEIRTQSKQEASERGGLPSCFHTFSTHIFVFQRFVTFCLDLLQGPCTELPSHSVPASACTAVLQSCFSA